MSSPDLPLGELAGELSDAAPCGYLSTAPDGTILAVNETFVRMTGYARDALVGRRRFVELLTAGGRLYHETHYAPMLAMQGRAREIALDLVCADGSRLSVLVSSELVRGPDGSPQIIRAAVFDATERRSYEREIVLARRRAEGSEARARALVQTLQQVLVPPTPPRIPTLDVAGVYRPARHGEEVGGDFYDVFQTGPDAWVVVIGDVCGKGIEAAVVTALLRHTLRAAVVAQDGLGAALTQVNQELLDHGSNRSSTAAVVARRRSDTGWHATVCCAGHPLPLLVRRGHPAEPVGAPGTLLGILPDPAFHEVAVELATGDRLVLYTDGVTEGRRAGRFYEVDRLRRLVEADGPDGPDAATQAQRVVDDAVAFQDGTTRDDIAVVVVRAGEPDR
jgi:sigma-B regulation protein RsbU (phosphoserine phosphatase)